MPVTQGELCEYRLRDGLLEIKYSVGDRIACSQNNLQGVYHPVGLSTVHRSDQLGQILPQHHLGQEIIISMAAVVSETMCTLFLVN